jgi:cysteine desulfurase/selenocysteine lyase
MTLPIDRLRADTPGCEHVIHLNNAGAGLMPGPVLDTIKSHLDLEATIGAYEAADRRRDALEGAYDVVADFLNASRDEIAFIENATRAWDMAFYSIPFKPGDRLLTAQAEYVSNYLAYLQAQKRYGIDIDVIPNDEYGQVSVAALEDMLDERVRLVAVTHVPTNGGLTNPVEAIGQVTRDAGVLYLLDACQSAGQMPLDVAGIGCDMLSATGRKYLRGPRGTGFLYVRKALVESLDPPFVDLHAAEWTATSEYELRPDARRFENWETNVAGKLGLSRAVQYAGDVGIAESWSRIQALAAGLRERLRGLRRVHVADEGHTLCGIVTFHVDGKASADVVSALRRRHINLSAVEVTSARLDLESRNLPALVRASVHYYNTDAELDDAAAAIEAVSSS